MSRPDPTPPVAGPAVGDRPDVFISYAREDGDFAERRLAAALVAHGKDVWIDVEDIRGGAADWRATVWAGIESAKVMVFVLTPDSLQSSVCGDELRHAAALNKRIIPVLRHSVEGLDLAPDLARPNWIVAREDDDFDVGMAALVAALELDEAWVEQHARYTQRTAEWLRADRDPSSLLRGNELLAAERWLDDQGAHDEQPTKDQVTYITAGRRAAARRQRSLLGAAGLALVVMTALAIVAYLQREIAIDRQHTAQAQAAAAQALARLSDNPERSVELARKAVGIRRDEPEARFALRKAVDVAHWTSLLRAGASEVNDVELSDDGRRVATASADGTVAVWSTPGRRRGIKLKGHADAVNTVVFSPGGRRLLTASDDGTARTWDAATGRPLRVLRPKSGGEVYSATYGAGGRLIATATPHGAEIFDAEAGTLVAALGGKSDQLGTIRLSLDGRRALTPEGEHHAALWDVARERRVATLRGKGVGTLRFAVFSGDGRRVATMYSDGAVRVWSAAHGRLVMPLRSQSETVTDTDISYDGRRVLAAGNGQVEVWDVDARKRIALLRNGAPVRSALFDRTGELVATGDDANVARVWRVAGERVEQELAGHTAAVNRARFNVDATRVATASVDGSVRLWPARRLTPRDAAWQRADGTSMSPDGRHVLVVDGERRAVWDTADGTVVRLDGGNAPLFDQPSRPCGRATGCAPWSPDGRSVAGASSAAGAVVWNAADGTVQRALGRASGSVLGAAFSRDGRRVVVVDSERTRAQIWNLRSGRPEASVPARLGEVLASAQFAGDSRRVLTVDGLGRAQLSDPLEGSSVSLSVATKPPAVAVAPNGREVAIGTSDGELRVISDPLGDKRTRTRRAAAGKIVSSVGYNRRGTLIATGAADSNVRIWDMDKLGSTPLTVPSAEVTGVAFTPDDAVVLVTAGSRTQLWDLAFPRKLGELPESRNVGAELSADGRLIVLAGDDRLEAFRCYACAPIDALVDHAESLLARGAR